MKVKLKGERFKCLHVMITFGLINNKAHGIEGKLYECLVDRVNEKMRSKIKKDVHKPEYSITLAKEEAMGLYCWTFVNHDFLNPRFPYEMSVLQVICGEVQKMVVNG